jgi:hypothetical protein
VGSGARTGAGVWDDGGGTYGGTGTAGRVGVLAKSYSRVRGAAGTARSPDETTQRARGNGVGAV